MRALVRPVRIVVVVLAMLATAGAARAQSSVPNIDDLAEAYHRLKISRSAVGDQLELCGDDRDKLLEAYRDLRPGGDADTSEWKDWSDLLHTIGRDLYTCLHGHRVQIALFRSDLAELRRTLPALDNPGRVPVNARQAADIRQAAKDGDRDAAGYDRQAADMADQADAAAADAIRLVRQAGVDDVQPFPSFKSVP